mmetsp:Transcript_6185/g.24075  ORF Transcript_6185/g.24075 Transcript_6185/m.24075 type:complete len:484 (-) Transcript_6185:134-1585(-)
MKERRAVFLVFAGLREAIVALGPRGVHLVAEEHAFHRGDAALQRVARHPQGLLPLLIRHHRAHAGLERLPVEDERPSRGLLHAQHFARLAGGHVGRRAEHEHEGNRREEHHQNVHHQHAGILLRDLKHLEPGVPRVDGLEEAERKARPRAVLLVDFGIRGRDPDDADLRADEDQLRDEEHPGLLGHEDVAVHVSPVQEQVAEVHLPAALAAGQEAEHDQDPPEHNGQEHVAEQAEQADDGQQAGLAIEGGEARRLEREARIVVRAEHVEGGEGCGPRTRLVPHDFRKVRAGRDVGVDGQEERQVQDGLVRQHDPQQDDEGLVLHQPLRHAAVPLQIKGSALEREQRPQALHADVHRHQADHRAGAELHGQDEHRLAQRAQLRHIHWRQPGRRGCVRTQEHRVDEADVHVSALGQKQRDAAQERDAAEPQKHHSAEGKRRGRRHSRRRLHARAVVLARRERQHQRRRRRRRRLVRREVPIRQQA